MKKSDLKQLIKPLVKECIHEVLLEEGLLSNVVSEVVKGMQQGMIVENTSPKAPNNKLLEEQLQMREQSQESQQKLKNHRKKLMDSFGKDAYNGVNLFENTEPMDTPSEPKPGSVDLGNPRDAGVDISSLVGGASQIWQALK
tara:strand:+ start:114 stop:539 length:426 start_codon:yes stop_codon:yes gene_type:complete